MSYIRVAASERVRIPVGMVWGLLLVGAFKGLVPSESVVFQFIFMHWRGSAKVRLCVPTPHRARLVILWALYFYQYLGVFTFFTEYPGQ